MMPVTKSAKATLNSNVWSSPHLARNVGKMLSNVAMMIEVMEGYGEQLWRWEGGRCVEQLELRRVVADGLRELGVLLLGQRLNLFLLVITVLDVLHHCG